MRVINSLLPTANEKVRVGNGREREKNMQQRRKLFYDTLVQFSLFTDEWIDKRTLAETINYEYFALTGIMTAYKLNTNPLAHDVCSLMNGDRLAINADPNYEKIILVKDNQFKIANREETIAEEKKLRAEGLKALHRSSLLKAKRLNNKQIIVDFDEEVLKIIETYIGE